MSKENKESRKEKKKGIEVIDEGIGVRVDTKLKAGNEAASMECCTGPTTPVR